jgi:hypothetical protein
MGLEDMIDEVKNVATGQGGNDGDNNANNSDGSNDKTVDTMVDSGSYPSLCSLHMTGH